MVRKLALLALLSVVILAQSPLPPTLTSSNLATEEEITDLTAKIAALQKIVDSQEKRITYLYTRLPVLKPIAPAK